MLKLKNLRNKKLGIKRNCKWKKTIEVNGKEYTEEEVREAIQSAWETIVELVGVCLQVLFYA